MNKKVNTEVSLLRRELSKMPIPDLDQEILKIQRSTKTTFRPFIPVHDKLRMKYSWYYKWHTNKYASKIHLSVFAVYFLALFASVSISLFGMPTFKARAASFSTVQSGDWTDQCTWSATCDGGIPGSSDDITINAGHTVTVSTNVTANGIISGEGAIIKNTAYITLTLAGANTFSGGITLNDGQININNPSAIGTGTFTINGGSFANTSGAGLTSSTNNNIVCNGSFLFNSGSSFNMGSGDLNLTSNCQMDAYASSGGLTIAGNISGNYGIIKGSSGEIILSGSNNYTGLTTINAGILTLTGANATTAGLTINSGTLNINHHSALGAGTLTINGGGFANSSGSPITLSTNNPQIWNGNFLFSAGSALNMGTGSITLTSNSQISSYSGSGILNIPGNISGSYGIT
jgi:autotransporter-associated beta strand protein